jgi:mRNA interferase MazF
MNFSRSDVILLPIPFSDLSSRKVRPAVDIGHSSHAGDLFVVPISFAAAERQQAGLNVRCGTKSQLATVEDRLIVKLLGRFPIRDHAELERRLRGWLAL